jgi:hypothetical protein
MALTISKVRYTAILAKIMRRTTEALAAEIAATDWDHEVQFANVDDFLKHADTFIEQSETDPSRSPKRP